MKGFYAITQTIKDQLLSDVDVNTVTTGDITRIDLGKQSMFPLSHIIVNNAIIHKLLPGQIGGPKNFVPVIRLFF